MRLTKAQLLDLALEALDYVAKANYNHREQTARLWLKRVWEGKTDKSLDEISDELEEVYERARIPRVAN
ncbi:hypothetical protein LCGC14_2917750 [marine sediment metagenome]|uniref:Uncharacterized protein n=1 Tax=marine sediment metagenome TaxID=412755 RepID=A0A0F8ZX92_9ZZZZ